MRARICPGTLMWRRQEGLNRSKKELMLISLDKEAKRLGVPRQSIIKVWVAERLGLQPSH